MIDAYPWYGVVAGEHLSQGDFLASCPNLLFHTASRVGYQTFQVVVMSQSCDLDHDKLEIVQVCPYWPLESLAAHVEFLRGKRGREELRRGNVPGYHLLNRCAIPGRETDHLVVDFRSLFGVSIATLKSLAAQQSPRLRLLPPYREHLAQAFARFFMRVGLPVDIPAFA